MKERQNKALLPSIHYVYFSRHALVGVNLVLSCLILSSCATKSFDPFGASQLDVDVRHAPRQGIDQTIQQQSEAIHSYLLGEIAMQRRDTEGAINSFARAKELFNEPTPSLHATLAALYLEQQKLPQALEAITYASKAEPENADHVLFRASLLQVLTHTSEAEAAYLQYSQMAPENFQGPLLLGVLYSVDGRHTDALQQFDKALARSPKSSLVLAYRARTLERLGRLKEARSDYEAASAMEPGNSHLFLDLVRVLATLDDIEEIRSRATKLAAADRDNQTARRVLMYLSLEEKADQNPAIRLRQLTPSALNTVDTRYRLALLAMRAQDPIAALRELRLVLAEDPENADARYNVAAVLSSIGDTSDAVQELSYIKKSAPLYVKARTFAAFLLRQEKDYEGAERALREALSVEENDDQILNFLVILLRETKKHAEARVIVEKQLARDPDNDRLLFSYATLLHDMNDSERALETMERVVMLNPENSDALNFVAFALAERGDDLDRAEKLIEQALRTRPNDGFYLDTLGWIYYQRGAYADAESVLSRAVQLSGEDPEILEHHGDALVKVGNRVEARRAYQRALERIQDEASEDATASATRLREKISELDE